MSQATRAFGERGTLNSSFEDERPTASAPTVIALAPRWATIGLFVIALFYTVYFAAPVLIPITIAILLSMLLSPAVEWLERLRLPRALASAIIVMGTLGLIITAVVTLAGPAQEWVTRLPASFDKLEQRLKLIKKPIAEIQRATEQIENVTELSQKPAQRRQIVELRRPSFAGELLSGHAAGRDLGRHRHHPVVFPAGDWGFVPAQACRPDAVRREQGAHGGHRA